MGILGRFKGGSCAETLHFVIKIIRVKSVLIEMFDFHSLTQFYKQRLEKIRAALT